MRLRPALLDLLYPPRCPFCGRVLERGEDRLCALCQRELPRTDGPGPAPEGCDVCLSPLFYRDGVRRAVHLYKFKGGAELAGLFGELMAQCPSGRRDRAADLVTWVPLHPKRKKRRGYDQAELLARRTAELCGIPAISTLEKVRNTGVQSRQNTEADRRANVEGASRALPGLDLTGKRVILVDDVTTTGSTLAQCAACLRSAGAAAVAGLTFARAGHLEESKESYYERDHPAQAGRNGTQGPEPPGL